MRPFKAGMIAGVFALVAVILFMVAMRDVFQAERVRAVQNDEAERIGTPAGRFHRHALPGQRFELLHDTEFGQCALFTIRGNSGVAIEPWPCGDLAH